MKIGECKLDIFTMFIFKPRGGVVENFKSVKIFDSRKNPFLSEISIWKFLGKFLEDSLNLPKESISYSP